ncbi:MAG: SAM-dependent methyltransferase, partial [bacterium]|nr:SAM-dependent methyltransferase [bacterium]
METDFVDAAKRHWEDANFLLDENRLANADHLFGLSAECALKAVMKGLGMPVRPDGSPSQYRIHINRLWDEFISFAQKQNGARYEVYLAGQCNPFFDWDIAQRYSPRSEFTQPDVQHHQ